MPEAVHRSMPELEAGLDGIRRSPADAGTLELIVRRPAVDEREVLEHGTLDLAEGLVGDRWRMGSRPELDRQLTLMNSRTVALVAQAKERWPLAGDQLYLDLDLSEANLPAGTQLAIGTAVIEVTVLPHNGCAKFAARFGRDANDFVNSPLGKELHLRGINARVVQPGTVRVGDVTTKVRR